MNWNDCAKNHNGASVHGTERVQADYIRRLSEAGPDGVTREYVTPLCSACVEAEKAAEVAYLPVTRVEVAPVAPEVVKRGRK